MKELKRKIYQHCKEIIEAKMDELRSLLKSYQSSANVETKSSAGDKYETGRAMMHLEKEKVASQLNQSLNQHRALGEIKPDQITEVAKLGSLIRTDHGYFFLSISLGKVSVGEDIFCISPVSPLGKVLVGKRAQDLITFQNRSYQVLEVV